MFPMRRGIFFNGNYERNWKIKQTGRKNYQWSYDYWLQQSGIKFKAVNPVLHFFGVKIKLYSVMNVKKKGTDIENLS